MSVSIESVQHLSTADLWAMLQYAELMRIEAQRVYDMYKERDYAPKYKSKLDYWNELKKDLTTLMNSRINSIKPMYP